MRGRIAAQILLAIVAAGCSGVVNQEYTSPEGRYRAQFPGKPKLSEQPPIMTPVGPVVEKNATSETWSTVRFVSYADYPRRPDPPRQQGPGPRRCLPRDGRPRSS